MAAFHSTPMHDLGLEIPTSSYGVRVQGRQCTTFSSQLLLLAPVLRSHPGVAPWLPHEGLANGEGGRGPRPQIMQAEVDFDRNYDNYDECELRVP